MTFFLILTISLVFPRKAEEEEIEEQIPNEIYDTPIEQLDLSVRVFNSLKRTGITKVGEMLDYLNMYFQKFQ